MNREIIELIVLSLERAEAVEKDLGRARALLGKEPRPDGEDEGQRELGDACEIASALRGNITEAMIAVTAAAYLMLEDSSEEAAYVFSVSDGYPRRIAGSGVDSLRFDVIVSELNWVEVSRMTDEVIVAVIDIDGEPFVHVVSPERQIRFTAFSFQEDARREAKKRGRGTSRWY